MRIRRLWIDEFKNLRDFNMSFGNHLSTVLIGANGTGKSNLLEALAIIFRDLDLELKNKDALSFEYILEYQCKGRHIFVDANPSQTYAVQRVQPTLVPDLNTGRRRARLLIRVDDKQISMREFFDNKHEYLPNHVFGYYSGPTNRLAKHFDHHQKIFYDQQLAGEQRPLRPLFFALPVHSQFVLLAYYAAAEPVMPGFLEEYIGISDLESLRFIIKVPSWKRFEATEDPFWGARGIPRNFLQDLYDIALAPSREGTGPDERLHLHIQDSETLRRLASRYGDGGEFFKNLETLYIADLISEVLIRVWRVGTDETITFPDMSEGEQQILTVLGLMLFTRDEETLFLLDEPDTHLNAVWKYEFLELVEPIVGDDSQCQILLATHDPIVISSCLKEQVRVLAFDGGQHSGDIIWYEPEEDPRGMGVAALLTSDVYGLRSSLDWVTQRKLDEKRELVAKHRLTRPELERLDQLNEELANLGFVYSFRDELYEDFVEVVMKELQEQPDLRGKVLTKEQQERRKQLIESAVQRVKKEEELEP